jgi:nucleoside-diphosphate-sugar epimerase
MYFILGGRGLLGSYLIDLMESKGLDYLSVISDSQELITDKEKHWSNINSKYKYHQPPTCLINAAGKIFLNAYTTPDLHQRNLLPFNNCIEFLLANPRANLVQISTLLVTNRSKNPDKSEYLKVKKAIETSIRRSKQSIRQRVTICRLPTLLDSNYSHSQLISDIVKSIRHDYDLELKHPKKIIELIPARIAATKVLDVALNPNPKLAEVRGVRISIKEFVRLFIDTYTKLIELNIDKPAVAQHLLSRYSNGISSNYVNLEFFEEIIKLIDENFINYDNK